MTRKTYVSWYEVSAELRQIEKQIDELFILYPGIDFGHGIAERIRQLGRDMEPPTGPVRGEEKEK